MVSDSFSIFNFQFSDKKLKAVSRQPLTNFVNLKSNTIMKKPRCKDTTYRNPCQVKSR